MIGVFLKLLPYFRRLSFFEYLQGFRTCIAGSVMAYTGIIGLLFGAVPIPTGEGVTWAPMDTDNAYMMLIGGLGLLGLGGKLDGRIKK